MSYTTPTLFIVDDDVALRTAFARALERAGYDVVTTTGSPDLIGMIEDRKPAAVLLDNHMPGASGVELIGMIRNRWTPQELPIVLISGSSIQGEIDLAMAAGANDFRRKPVELADLISTVRALVEQVAVLSHIEQGANS